MVIFAVALSGCATAVGQGDTALHAGRPVEAARYFEEALAAEPDRLDARIGLGIAHFRMGAWSAARASLEDALATAPRRAETRLYLGLVHLMEGDVAAGRAQLTALRGLPIHFRIAAQLDRVLPLLIAGLDPTLRDVVVAQLDDAYEWMTELERARTSRGPFTGDHSYPPALYRPYWGAPPSP